MASSVTIAISNNANSASSWMRVGGTLQPGITSTSTPSYFVTAGKRMVLKAKGLRIGPAGTPGRLSIAELTTYDGVDTLVIGGGVTVEFILPASAIGYFLSGYLEDDI